MKKTLKRKRVWGNVRGGKQYTFTSPESRYAQAPEKNYLGFTFKTGGNYNINDFNNVFVNVGYLKLAPRFTNVFDRNNRLFTDVDYQYVKAIELGYGYKQKKFRLAILPMKKQLKQIQILQ
jgi:hypothetical protein